MNALLRILYIRFMVFEHRQPHNPRDSFNHIKGTK